MFARIVSASALMVAIFWSVMAFFAGPAKVPEPWHELAAAVVMSLFAICFALIGIGAAILTLSPVEEDDTPETSE